MRETSKCHDMRMRRGDFKKFLCGTGIDMGAGNDPLRPPEGPVRAWDKTDGDAEGRDYNLPQGHDASSTVSA
jgi:hypothetical protein